MYNFQGEKLSTLTKIPLGLSENGDKESIGYLRYNYLQLVSTGLGAMSGP